MSHYAIIKANRKDVEWYFNDSRSYIEYYKECADEDYDVNYSWKYTSYEDRWAEAIDCHKLDYKLYHTGTYTEWEGLVDLDILQVGVHIYVPSLNEYHLVSKVEAHTEGKVIYHIDYDKEFTDNSELSRIKAVEHWFEVEYPMYDNYTQLINNQDEVNQLKLEYYAFYEKKRNEKDLEKELKEKYNYEKPITLTDSSNKNKKSLWQRLFD